LPNKKGKELQKKGGETSNCKEGRGFVAQAGEERFHPQVHLAKNNSAPCENRRGKENLFLSRKPDLRHEKKKVSAA